MQANKEAKVTFFKDYSGPQLQQAINRLEKAVRCALVELNDYHAHNANSPVGQ